LRTVVADELDAVAERFGTPRRTLLTEANPSIAAPRGRGAAAPVLEIADTPCRILLSTTGRAVRVDLSTDAPLLPPARRSKHDAVLSAVDGTTRGELAAITSRGRFVRFTPVGLPGVPANSLQLGAGAKLRDYIGLTDAKERIVAIVDPSSPAPLALGTRDGVVKRVAPGGWPARPDGEVIALKAGDEVVGAAPAEDDRELVFVTSDAQLLHFGADQVRPQGLPAGGMAGIKLGAGARVLFFGVVDPASAEVVTVSGSSATIAGTDPGRAKVSSFAEFPGKGRATGGVRAHAFLKGEDALQLRGSAPSPRVAPTARRARSPTAHREAETAKAHRG